MSFPHFSCRIRDLLRNNGQLPDGIDTLRLPRRLQRYIDLMEEIEGPENKDNDTKDDDYPTTSRKAKKAYKKEKDAALKAAIKAVKTIEEEKEEDNSDQGEDDDKAEISLAAAIAANAADEAEAAPSIETTIEAVATNSISMQPEVPSVGGVVDDVTIATTEDDDTAPTPKIITDKPFSL